MSYHIVYVPENETPQHFKFDSKEHVQAWFMSLQNLDCHVFVFKGDRLMITHGVFRYLMENDDAVPLFKLPSPGSPSYESCLDDLKNLDPDYSNLTPGFQSEEEEEEEQEDS
mgnify:CR=1 FL=1